MYSFTRGSGVGEGADTKARSTLFVTAEPFHGEATPTNERLATKTAITTATNFVLFAVGLRMSFLAENVFLVTKILLSYFLAPIGTAISKCLDGYSGFI
jgi:hypothetical protein